MQEILDILKKLNRKKRINMKVLTIKQPWATLIAEGVKEYEFRTWNTKYRGNILIHAGKGIDKDAMKRFKDLNYDFQTGCIIAKAILTDSIPVDDDFVKKVGPTNPLVYKGIIEKRNWDGYGFKLEKVKKIEPIYVNGKLGLWNFEYKNQN